MRKIGYRKLYKINWKRIKVYRKKRKGGLTFILLRVFNEENRINRKYI